ncbi:hypothetical protein [Reyranella sp.]|uniref:hypothetical protein n=1 Tax=Reyranella sp. TaxID=1929291 RepID=UPI00273193B7|nr:hypothetical protein [Reyranella sp.]MDP2377336.1 hypothetical protein [Reyranella sp.]
MPRLILALAVLSFTSAVSAQEKGIAPKDGPSNFDRTHRTIDRTMNTGNDRSPPLGSAPRERTGLGGQQGGGNAHGTQNDNAIRQRNQ